MTVKKFLKIRVNGLTRFVRVLKEGPEVCTGMRVTKTGEDWFKETKTTVTEELVMFAPGDVICEMVVNWHYAELERKTP